MIRRSRAIWAVSVSMVAAAAACERPLAPGGGAAGNAGASGNVGAAGSLGMTGAAGSAGAGAPPASGNAGAAPCARIDETWSAKLPSDVLILLDASGSMNDDSDNASCSGGCGATSKWAKATAALDLIVARTESTVNWGLKTFADADLSCGVLPGVAVPVAAMNAGAIATAILGRTSANGGVTNGSRTPTRAAVKAGASYLAALPDAGPKLLLLLTDGLPNCGAGSDAAADDSAATLRAVADARALGVSTVVVGIATAGGAADQPLNDIAVAGGFPRSGATPAYTPLSSIDDLAMPLTLLTSHGASDCMFALPPTPDGAQRPPIGLRAGDTEIPFDASHQNGWDWSATSGDSVQVFGPVCDDIRAGRIQMLTIEFYCPGD